MTIPRRNRTAHFALMERKGGPMEAKAGAKVKRAKQVKATQRELRYYNEEGDIRNYG